MYSLNNYLQDTFGCKVYKLALDGGMTCPNRDGRIDDRGCIFCSQGGSGEFAASRILPIDQQIESAKLRIKNKVKDGKYIAYFQNFSNTYGDVRYLNDIYRQAISSDEIVALSVATRPDCLPPEVISLLCEINKIKPVFVELGLQTIHERTSRYIRRGYPLEVYDKAVESLKEISVHIVVHVIIGLPGESQQDILDTVRYVVNSGVHGIKLQLLHILKGTDLEKDYNEGKVRVLSLEEYVDIVAKCVAVIPDNVVIHRLTGDGDKKLLVAPLWSGQKKTVLNAINKRLKAQL